MIAFEKFIVDDKSPIYMQIIRYVERGIIAGNIKNQDEMPSRRVLASLLGVNPNTVQKAYHMLEQDEIIESRSGAKSCVVIDADKIKKIHDKLLKNDANSIITAMKQMGISKTEAIELIEKLWE